MTKRALLESQNGKSSTFAPRVAPSTAPSTSSSQVLRSARDVVVRPRVPLSVASVLGFYWLAANPSWQGALDVIFVIGTYAALMLAIDVVSTPTPSRLGQQHHGPASMR